MARPASSRHSATSNRLLAGLPPDDLARVQPHLELVPLPLGWAVYESEGPQSYVYFPTDSIVSLLYVTEDGASAEIAVVGNDGAVGMALFMGGETTPSRALDAVGATTSVFINGTATVGGDLGAAAKGAVEGVIEGAKDIGVDATEAASAAAAAAVKAVGKIGAAAGTQVRNAVTGTIAGIKVVVKEPLK